MDERQAKRLDTACGLLLGLCKMGGGNYAEQAYADLLKEADPDGLLSPTPARDAATADEGVRWYGSPRRSCCFEVTGETVQFWNGSTRRWEPSMTHEAGLITNPYCPKLTELEARRIIGKWWRGDRWFNHRDPGSRRPYVRVTPDGRVFNTETGRESSNLKGSYVERYVSERLWDECDSHGTPLAEATATRYFTRIGGFTKSASGRVAYVESRADGGCTVMESGERYENTNDKLEHSLDAVRRGHWKEITAEEAARLVTPPATAPTPASVRGGEVGEKAARIKYQDLVYKAMNLIDGKRGRSIRNGPITTMDTFIDDLTAALATPTPTVPLAAYEKLYGEMMQRVGPGPDRVRLQHTAAEVITAARGGAVAAQNENYALVVPPTPQPTDAAGADTLRGAAEDVAAALDMIAQGLENTSTASSDPYETRASAAQHITQNVTALRAALAASKGEGAVCVRRETVEALKAWRGCWTDAHRGGPTGDLIAAIDSDPALTPAAGEEVADAE